MVYPMVYIDDDGVIWVHIRLIVVVAYCRFLQLKRATGQQLGIYTDDWFDLIKIIYPRSPWYEQRRIVANIPGHLTDMFVERYPWVTYFDQDALKSVTDFDHWLAAQQKKHKLADYHQFSPLD